MLKYTNCPKCGKYEQFYVVYVDHKDTEVYGCELCGWRETVTQADIPKMTYQVIEQSASNATFVDAPVEQTIITLDADQQAAVTEIMRLIGKEARLLRRLEITTNKKLNAVGLLHDATSEEKRYLVPVVLDLLLKGD